VFKQVFGELNGFLGAGGIENRLVVWGNKQVVVHEMIYDF
jgi:hypothetical protein